MLDYNVYQEKRKNYRKYEREFEKENELWEKEMLRLIQSFKKHNFLPVLNEDGTYEFSHYNSFYPERYMDRNSIMVTRSNISMMGWDEDGDKCGFIKIKVEDLLREDRDEYFLNLYNNFSKNEKKKIEDEMENRERAIYEKLKEKYGNSEQ